MFSLRKLFLKKQAEQEMNDELRFHLEKQIEQNKAQGMSAEEARYAALRQFGNLGAIKEECREVWGVRLLSEIAQDVRYGLRQLRRKPGFTIVAILTLALGIGVNTAMFSFVDAVILHPLPYPRPHQLVTVNQERIQRGHGWHIEMGVSAPNLIDIQHENRVFQEIGCFSWTGYHVGKADSTDFVTGPRVSPSMLATLGVQPALGRGFTKDDSEPGHNHVVILGYGIWQKLYRGKHDALGKTLTLNGLPFTIVGVMPKNFLFLYDLEPGVLTPLAFTPRDLSEPRRAVRNLRTLARLKPGVTVEQARAEMKTLAARLAQQYPEANKTWGLRVQSLHSSYYNDAQQYIAAILGAVLMVLLIACVNVASLLLSRSTVRRHEVAVRLALGARRSRLIRQLLTESVLLGIAGGAVGVLVALGGIKLLIAALAATHMYFPGMQWIGLNAYVLAFCFVLAAASGVFFGLAPAWHSSKFNLSEALKEGGVAVTAEASRRRLRNSLMASEVALAVLLMTAGGLLIRSFVKMMNVPLGFNPHHLLVTAVGMPNSKGLAGSTENAFFSDLVDRMRHLPGVKSAAFGDAAPEYEPGGEEIFIATEGRPRPAPGHEAAVPLRAVGPGFTKALGVTLLAGRYFTAADDQGSTPVTIINEAMAKRFWPNTNPLGMHVTILSSLAGPRSPMIGKTLKVVGVVATYVTFDYLYKEKHSLVMVPFAQDPQAMSAVIIRSGPPSKSLVPALRKIVRAVTKRPSAQGFFTWNQLLERDFALRSRRLPMTIVWIFASLAIILTAVGIFGVVSYSVSQRTHEMAIRMSLGAQQPDVVRLVVGEGLRVVLVGLAVGLAAALAMGRLLASYIYGVTARDPITFVLVGIVMLGVAVLAALIPARRASRVDPMVILRHE